MRLIFTLPLLTLAACQVTTDDKNDQMTIQYNEDVAENGIADVANTAEDLAGKVSNDVEQTADKVQDKTQNLDVDVDVDTDGNKAN
jgi:hypothetical protein